MASAEPVALRHPGWVLETMVMMGTRGVPDYVIRQQLASAIHLVRDVARLSDGTRKVTGMRR